MPSYKVKEKGFFGGVFRVPGGKHDPVVTANPIPKNKMPSWLEEIKPSTKTSAGRKKAAAKVTEPNESKDDFMGKDEDVETL